jgi:hypothetical protein
VTRVFQHIGAEALWQATLGALGSLPWEPVAEPADLARAEAGPEGRRTTLAFHSFVLPGVAQLRATVIVGPRVQIFNAMAFPLREDQLPILATEVVLFGDSLRIGVVDLETAGEGPVAERTAAALDGLAPVAGAFTRVDPLPEWCAAYFSPQCIVTRADGLDDLPRLADALAAFAGSWADLVGEAGAAAMGDAPGPGVQAYKHHHIVHSPGLVFLGRMFGEEWTRRYMAAGMYR